MGVMQLDDIAFTLPSPLTTDTKYVQFCSCAKVRCVQFCEWFWYILLCWEG